MKITIGAVPYFWSANRLRDFYATLPHDAVDAVYVGETVCSKRRALRTGEWIELARELATRFPEVLLSTLTLIEADSELATLRRLCENGELRIEANDYAAVMLLQARGLPFVAGPFLNIYHSRALALAARRGAFRWVPPLEMSGALLRQLLDAYDGPAIETEVFAYGRVPLAHSARCFTARAHDRNKDDCGFICGEHDYGMPVATRDGDDFLCLNGIQVQSAKVHAVTDVAALREAGANALRLVPANPMFHDVVAAYARACRDGSVALPHDSVDGYWRGAPGMAAEN